jgi:hypothetical protein
VLISHFTQTQSGIRFLLRAARPALQTRKTCYLLLPRQTVREKKFTLASVKKCCAKALLTNGTDFILSSAKCQSDCRNRY